MHAQKQSNEQKHFVYIVLINLYKRYYLIYTIIFQACQFTLQLNQLNKIKMSRNINPTSKLKIQEQQIRPWNVQDSNQLNPIDSTMLNYIHKINDHTISFNPEISKTNQPKIRKSLQKGHIFYDNLRKYQTKKAEQMLIRRDNNFIEKNKLKIFEDFGLQSQQTKNSSMLMSNLFVNDKTSKNAQENISGGGQPINWSLIMYYQTQKNKRKPRHKDMQSFLRFQSQTKERQSLRQNRQNPQINQQNIIKFQQDKFQKILKLKDGIRRRNLKSASSSSKQNLYDSQQPLDLLRQSQNTNHRAHGIVQFYKTILPKTSYSARIPKKNEKTSSKIQVIGFKNAVVMNKQALSDLRMIHSSHKNRPNNKLLNINGNKIQSSKKFNNNI